MGVKLEHESAVQFCSLLCFPFAPLSVIHPINFLTCTSARVSEWMLCMFSRSVPPSFCLIPASLDQLMQWLYPLKNSFSGLFYIFLLLFVMYDRNFLVYTFPPILSILPSSPLFNRVTDVKTFCQFHRVSLRAIRVMLPVKQNF